jgi:hypothetical protein
MEEEKVGIKFNATVTSQKERAMRIISWARNLN